MKLRKKGRTDRYHKGVMRNDVMLTMTLEARTLHYSTQARQHDVCKWLDLDL